MLAALPWLRWRRICGGDSRLACPEPELPEPRRKSPGSPALQRPRLYSGAAGLARLGHSPGAACRSGASPGSSSPPRRAAVSPCAGTPSPPDAHISPPSDFLRPGPLLLRLWPLQPTAGAGLGRGAALLDTYGVRMPTCGSSRWRRKSATRAADATECFLARQREQLQSALLELASRCGVLEARRTSSRASSGCTGNSINASAWAEAVRAAGNTGEISRKEKQK